MSCSYNRCSHTRHSCTGGCGCRRYPFYTGPCPSACECRICRGGNAQVTMDRDCGFGNFCHNCNGCCECNFCHNCAPMPPAPPMPPMPPAPPLPPAPPVDPCPPLPGNFVSAAPLTVAAGGSIPLTANGTAAGYTVENGAVQIRNAGTYYLSYTVSVPAETALTTTITPVLNGVSLPAGAVSLDVVETDTPTAASGQTVFIADAGAVLTLSSSGAVGLTGTTPLLSLNLLRIGC